MTGISNLSAIRVGIGIGVAVVNRDSKSQCGFDCDTDRDPDSDTDTGRVRIAPLYALCGQAKGTASSRVRLLSDESAIRCQNEGITQWAERSGKASVVNCAHNQDIVPVARRVPHHFDLNLVLSPRRSTDLDRLVVAHQLYKLAIGQHPV